MLKKGFSYLLSLIRSSDEADDNERGPSYLVPPPVLMLLTIGLGFALSWLFPLYAYLPLWATALPILKILAVIVGSFAILLGFFSVYLFRQKNTSFHPGGVSQFMVGTGPYRFSRNPMYLSLLIMQLSIALYFLAVWVLVTLPILYWLLVKGVILPEEAYLAQRFGKDYLEYKSQVRRWI